MFELHTKLAQDCQFVCDLPLCRVLLMNEQRYPWFILVPRLAGLRELLALSDTQGQQYWQESNLVQRYLLQVIKADKLNVAALGNQVPQLHIHHIARFSGDAAWPGPVWGKFPPKAYSQTKIKEITTSFLQFTGDLEK